MNYNYNEMCRELGYDPSDPGHVDKMQDDFAHDELDVVGLTEEDLAILQGAEPTDEQLKEIEDEH